MAVSTHRELIASNTKAADDMIEIAVADTGSGFAGDALANLFQPFFTTKEAGMGVGLSISRTIIETHGGRMSAETNGSGGATFRFTLPVASAKDMTNAAERKSTLSTTIRRCASSPDFLLGSAGFSVRLFDSARAFLDELANLEAGCVVTDVRMPGIDGMELLRRLNSGPQKLPVIVMTGHGEWRPLP